MDSSPPASISLHLQNASHPHPRGLPEPAGACLPSSTHPDSLSQSSWPPLPPHCLLPCKLGDTFITSKCVNSGALSARPVCLLAAGGHSRLLALCQHHIISSLGESTRTPMARLVGAQEVYFEGRHQSKAWILESSALCLQQLVQS